MKKKILLLIIVLSVTVGACFYMNNKDVKVIDAHHNGWTASIMVDRLPNFQRESIEWWLNQKSAISAKYHFKADNPKGYLDYYIYAFGEGYQEEGKEDRLCFDEMNPPKNCIDKNLLMVVLKTREGNTQFRFDHGVYIQTSNGKIIRTK